MRDEPPTPQDPSGPKAPLLRAVNLVKEYHQRGLRDGTGHRSVLRALDDVSFDLMPGRTIGVVGESGSGKSTLAHILLALTRPTSGRVEYLGDDVFSLSRRSMARFRRGVQIVFQDPEASLSPRLPAEKIIDEAWVANSDVVPAAQRPERVRELMSLVGLDPAHATRYPHQFSGGQRQRLGIARALAVEPRVLVCDEPVSSLDVSVQAQIINLFQKLQRELGVAYVFIAHDLAVVRHIADSVIVMNKGKTVDSGPTDRVYENPSHPYTQALLDAIPVPDPSARARRRRASHGTPEARTDGPSASLAATDGAPGFLPDAGACPRAPEERSRWTTA
jgi:oligopeptide transport system ATP-binding protein